MKRSKIILWILILPTLAFGLHDYYISLTKVDYVAEKESVQIIMRFFIDDVEKVLETRTELPMELATKNEHENSDRYLEAYVRGKFKVDINGLAQNYIYLGKEYEHDIVYIYLEIENVKEINTIQVQNAMLFEEFEAQQNFIKLTLGEIQKTFILVKANDKEMLKL